MLGLLRSDRHAAPGAARGRDRVAQGRRGSGCRRQALEPRAVRFSNSSRQYFSRRLIRCDISIIGCKPIHGSNMRWFTAIGLALVAPGSATRGDHWQWNRALHPAGSSKGGITSPPESRPNAVHGQQGCDRRRRCGIAALCRCISPPRSRRQCGTSCASEVWQVDGVCLAGRHNGGTTIDSPGDCRPVATPNSTIPRLAVHLAAAAMRGTSPLGVAKGLSDDVPGILRKIQCRRGGGGSGESASG
jgi:hypothetical protein